MATTEEELRIKFTGDASGYEAAANRVQASNNNMLQSQGKMRKGLIAFGSELTQAHSGLDLVGDSITTATRVFRVGIGSMVAAGIGNAIAGQLRQAAEESNKLSEGLEKVAGFTERNQFKGSGQLLSEIKEAEARIKDLQDKIHPKATDIHAQFVRQTIFATSGISPEEQDRDMVKEQEGLQVMIAERQEAGIGIEQRKLDIIRKQSEGRMEEADELKRSYDEALALNEIQTNFGDRAKAAAAEIFRLQNKERKAQLQFEKDSIRNQTPSGFGLGERARQLEQEYYTTKSQMDRIKASNPNEEKAVLSLKKEVATINNTRKEVEAQIALEAEKYDLAEKVLKIQKTNQSQESQKLQILKDEEDSLRRQAKIEEETNAAKAKADIQSANAKANEQRLLIQGANFGKSALDIQRRIRKEHREERMRDKFDSRNEHNHGMLPFGLHKDMDGNIVSGLDPITGRRINGPESKSFRDRLDPHLIRERGGDDAFMNQFKPIHDRKAFENERETLNNRKDESKFRGKDDRVVEALGRFADTIQNAILQSILH